MIYIQETMENILIYVIDCIDGYMDRQTDSAVVPLSSDKGCVPLSP